MADYRLVRSLEGARQKEEKQKEEEEEEEKENVVEKEKEEEEEVKEKEMEKEEEKEKEKEKEKEVKEKEMKEKEMEKEEEKEEEEEEEKEERDWAAIEPLEPVAERLNPVEYLALAGTCKRWRSLVKPLSRNLLASQPPLLMLFHPGRQMIAIACLTDGSTSFYRCPHSYFDCVGYSQGYLVMLSSEGRTSNMFFHYDYYSDGKARKDIEVLLYQPFTRRGIRYFPILKREIFKAIMSAPPSSPECVIVAISIFSDFLMYCRPGDAEWTEFACPYTVCMNQVVIARGKVYTLCEATGQVVAFSNVLETNLVPTAEKLPRVPVIGAPQGCALLTSAEGDLYLVCLTIISANGLYNHLSGIDYREIPNKAFRYDEAGKEWLPVQDFGGASAFLTWYGSILTDLNGSEKWKDTLCFCFRELGCCHLDTKGYKDIEWFQSWQETFKNKGFGRENHSLWRPSAYWVLPSLCYL